MYSNCVLRYWALKQQPRWLWNQYLSYTHYCIQLQKCDSLQHIWDYLDSDANVVPAIPPVIKIETTHHISTHTKTGRHIDNQWHRNKTLMLVENHRWLSNMHLHKFAGPFLICCNCCQTLHNIHRVKGIHYHFLTMLKQEILAEKLKGHNCHSQDLHGSKLALRG